MKKNNIQISKLKDGTIIKYTNMKKNNIHISELKDGTIIKYNNGKFSTFTKRGNCWMTSEVGADEDTKKIFDKYTKPDKNKI